MNRSRETTGTSNNESSRLATKALWGGAGQIFGQAARDRQSLVAARSLAYISQAKK